MSEIRIRRSRAIGVELASNQLASIIRAGVALPHAVTTRHGFARDGMTAVKVAIVAWDEAADVRPVGTLELVDLPPRSRADPLELHLEVDAEGRAVVATVTDVLSGRSERQVWALPEDWLA